MEKQTPKQFIEFLTSILQTESLTDQYKAKIFYVPIEQIWKILCPSKSSQQIVYFSDIEIFFAPYFSQIQYIAEEEKTILFKYFKFNSKSIKAKDQLLKKLKPINNKFIIMDLENKQDKQINSIQQNLVQLFRSILIGFDKIKLQQKKCSLKYDQIVRYFQQNFKQKCFTLDLLKQIISEINIYNRANFNYLKQYIFAQNQNTIQWQTIFKKPQIFKNDNYTHSRTNSSLMDEIKQQQAEYFITEKNIMLNKKSISLDQQKTQIESFENMNNQNQKKIQQQNNFSANKELNQTKKYQNYDKVLDQINQIQNILQKTKQKHLKNRQQLSLQANQIKRKHSNFNIIQKQKYSKYQQQNSSKKHQQKKFLKLNNHFGSRNCSQISEFNNDNFIQNFQNFNEMNLQQQSIIFTFNDKDIQNNEYLIQKKSKKKIQNLSNRKREVGKIKKRSLSKQSTNQRQSLQKQIKKTDQSFLFESVMKQVKKQDYSKLVQYKKQNYKRDKNHLKNQINQSYDFSNQIKFQQLSKSRKLSEKRQEIVKKATSQAKLRIQQIQKRALTRISKLIPNLQNDYKSNEYKNFSKKSIIDKYVPKNYLNINKSIQKYTQKFKITEEESKSRCRTSDLMNQRPSGKTSAYHNIDLRLRR